jgi:hypothetical protein
MLLTETVNQKVYLGVLWYLREAVQKKRSEIGGGGNKTGFFTAKLFPANSALRPEVSSKKQTLVFPQPPKRPDLSLQQTTSCNRN